MARVPTSCLTGADTAVSGGMARCTARAAICGPTAPSSQGSLRRARGLG
eukprot:CAMPEP_0180646688 /NCGR_PEP_ID=MMETSP1037_2-20121125/49821_1 /TAXON_ID=632150 /ORGANISM="Azadinium spinosum, Strain 3D9" /LENGTH=48 /DNA_ID= /DNA_START= /DNA_END= /DNA_ORIENTATION=